MFKNLISKLPSKAILLGALGCFLSALSWAQMDHSSHVGMMPAKPSVCAGLGLDCANAATPFLTTDGKLLLAWTAGGSVSVAQSADMGKTFGQPAVVAEHGKSLDTGSDARPQIVADSRGNVFLAYAFFKDSNWNAQVNIARSSDGAQTFSAPTSLVNDGSSQRFPSIVMRPDGSIFIAWIDKRLIAQAKKNGQSVLGGSIAYSFSNDGGNTFLPEKIANESSCECCRIGASNDPRVGVAIIYRAIFPGGIRDHATQIISPSSAGEVRRVSRDEWKTDTCPHHGPTIAVSESGKMHVAWFTQGSARSGVFYASSVNQGASYSKPIRIGKEESNVSRPYLLAIGSSVWLVWKEFDGSNTSIYMKQSNDDGKTWSAPKLISQTNGYSDHPLLINKGVEVFLSWLTRADGYQLVPLKSRP